MQAGRPLYCRVFARIGVLNSQMQRVVRQFVLFIDSGTASAEQGAGTVVCACRAFRKLRGGKLKTGRGR